MRVKTAIALVVAICSVVASNPVSAAPNPVPVQIVDFAFQPRRVSVVAGGSIKWTNQDSTTHTVTFDDLSADSGGIDTGGAFSARFPTVGQFSYHCNIHTTMIGMVTVTPAQAPPSSLTPRVRFPILLR